MILCGMLNLCRLILAIVIDLFQPRAAVEARRQDGSGLGMEKSSWLL
jgi:hypothetical protein